MTQQAVSEHTEQPTWVRLSQLLEQWPLTAKEVQSTIDALQTLYLWIPGPHINFPGGPWPTEKPRFVQKPHLHMETENFQIAMDNLAKAAIASINPLGRRISPIYPLLSPGMVSHFSNSP